MTKKERRHRFFNKHTILGTLILMVLGLLLCQIVGGLIGIPIDAICGDKNFAGGIGVAIAALLVLLVYGLWFRPEFEGNLRGGNVKTGIKLSMILVVYWIVSTPVGFALSDAVFGAPTLATIGMAMAAGFAEEVAFRGLPLSYLMRQWKEEKRILTAVLLTSLIFGGIHLLNISAGGNPGSVAVQTISAIAMGLFFGAVYLRSGNLWITMIGHTIHDIIAFTNVSGIEEGVVVSSVDLSSYFDLGCTVILGIIGLWLVRPSKRAEIRAIWDKKWNRG